MAYADTLADMLCAYYLARPAAISFKTPSIHLSTLSPYNDGRRLEMNGDVTAMAVFTLVGAITPGPVNLMG
jgi:hypothetical protein